MRTNEFGVMSVVFIGEGELREKKLAGVGVSTN